MLRSLIQPENVLIKLCQSREWEKVKSLLKTSPSEAKPTPSAYRGITSTALVFSILNGAPVDIVKALVMANSDQLMKVRHHRHGNALHEAIKHKSSIDIILFLIQTIIKLEKESIWVIRGELKPAQFEFDHRACIQEKIIPTRIQSHCTLLNQTDHFGRTPLHYLVERFTQQSGESLTFLHAIELLIQAYPPAVGKHDTDGLTPLDLCLISPKVTNSLREMEIEIKVFGLVKMMVNTYPSVGLRSYSSAQATIGSGFNSFDEFEAIGIQRHGSILVTNSRRLVKNTVDGNIAHNTLSHALMHGRHYSTIELLIGACKTNNPSWYTGHLYDWDEFEMEPLNEENESCMTIVSTDFEVPLHIAVTMRASPEVVAHVVKSGPDAAYIPDRCGLTPICWTWMRFVIDEIAKSEREPNENLSWTQPVVKINKRRFIPSRYLDFHERLSNDVALVAIECERATDISVLRHMHHNSIERRNMWSKLSCLLPNAAKAYTKHFKDRHPAFLEQIETISKWNPVHAAAFIDCPRAVLFSAIVNSHQSVKKVDEVGNLPVHYAAASHGYSKCLSTGVTYTHQQIQERSKVFDLVPLYPGCTKICNASGQLPIHIAIESEKKARVAISSGSGSRNNRNKRQRIFEKNVECVDITPLMYLVEADAESLEKSDGITNLYPFMQAAGKAKT